MRRMFGVVSVITIAMGPIAYLGWRGFVPSAFLLVVGLLAALSKYRLATGVIVLAAVLLLVERANRSPLATPLEAVHQWACKDNLRQIALAIGEFEYDHGKMPPVCTLYAQGKPLHSWRVFLLPYLEQQDLFEKIDKTVAWDHPVNVPFHRQMPDVYCCPTAKYLSRWNTTGGTTSYVAVVGPGTAWSTDKQISFGDITDGCSNTIAIVESERNRVNWVSPESPSLKDYLKSFDADDAKHSSIPFSHLDGSTHWLGNEELTVEELKKRFLIDDESTSN